MADVTLPNGDTISFPDDMGTDAINQAVKTHLSASSQSEGWMPSLADAGRAAMTVGTRGLGNLADFAMDPLARLRHLVSPDLERIEQSGKFQPGQAAGDAVFNATGIPELKPTSPLGRVALSGAEGAVGGGSLGVGGAIMGALSGAAGQGGYELTGSERLATALGLVPAVAGGVRAAMRDNSLAAPSATDLKAAGSAGYDAWRGSPVQYQRSAIADLADTIKARLQSDGTHAEDAPKTYEKLNRMFAGSQPAAAGGIPLAPKTTSEIQSTRRSFGKVTGDPTDVRAAGEARRALDDFLGNPGATAIASGTPAEVAHAAETFQKANANYRAAQQSNTLTGDLTRGATSLEERASARAASTNSGGNYDNALRQNVRSFLQNDKNLRGLTDSEIKALEVVRDGTVTRNVTRWLGNQLTNKITGAVGTYLGSGFGPVGAGVGYAIPQAIGYGLKRAENALARSGIESVDEMVRRRSPLYQEQLLSAPAIGRGQAIARQLLPGLIGAGGLYGPPQGGLYGQ